jgi:ABC-2 type transport system ATP-binding protein
VSDDLVVVDGLVRRRGAFTLEVPAWRVPPGTVVGVVGPNGAGKTTLLRLLPGLDRPDGGLVAVLGFTPHRDVAEVRTRVGWMTDDQPLFNMRIGDLLRFLSGYFPTWDPDLVERLMARFAVEPGRRVRDLSRGEGTRVRLVLAMAFRPRLLVLDEPGAGLDLAGRRALLASVLEVVRDPERSVIVSSHQVADVERIADRLLVLDRGRVLAEGETHALVGEGRTLEECLVAWGLGGRPDGVVP